MYINPKIQIKIMRTKLIIVVDDQLKNDYKRTVKKMGFTTMTQSIIRHMFGIVEKGKEEDTTKAQDRSFFRQVARDLEL